LHFAVIFFNSRYFFFNSRYFFFNICADTPEFIKVFLFRKAKSDFNSTVIRRIYRFRLGFIEPVSDLSNQFRIYQTTFGFIGAASAHTGIFFALPPDFVLTKPKFSATIFSALC